MDEAYKESSTIPKQSEYNTAQESRPINPFESPKSAYEPGLPPSIRPTMDNPLAFDQPAATSLSAPKNLAVNSPFLPTETIANSLSTQPADEPSFYSGAAPAVFDKPRTISSYILKRFRRASLFVLAVVTFAKPSRNNFKAILARLDQVKTEICVKTKFQQQFLEAVKIVNGIGGDRVYMVARDDAFFGFLNKKPKKNHLNGFLVALSHIITSIENVLFFSSFF